MANALKRVANYLGLMDDPQFDTTEVSRPPAVTSSGDVRIKARAVRQTSSTLSARSDIAPQLDLPVLDRIITLHPRFYNEARTIGEHFRQGNPVIINLTDMDESNISVSLILQVALPSVCTAQSNVLPRKSS